MAKSECLTAFGDLAKTSQYLSEAGRWGHRKDCLGSVRFPQFNQTRSDGANFSA